MLKYKKMSEQAYPPVKASAQAAGFDLCSPRSYTIKPGGVQLITLDLCIQLPEGSYGRIAPRSGLALTSQINVGAGVIDPDFRGNLGVVLFNHHCSKSFEIVRGDRIAQLICEKFVDTEAIECQEDWSTTERGFKGFGSTGVSTSSSMVNAMPLPQQSLVATAVATTPLIVDEIFRGYPPPPPPPHPRSMVMEEETGTQSQGLRFIFDVEGYFSEDGTAIVKELAFACVETDFLTGGFVVESPYKFTFKDFSESKRKFILIKTKLCHGIEWCDGKMSVDELHCLLYTILPSSAKIYVRDKKKREILGSILPDWKIISLNLLGCPSAHLLPYDKASFKECELSVHKSDSESQYVCALASVQKYRAWYREKKNIWRCYSSPAWKNLLKTHAYCCWLKCFDRYANPCEVDGLACDQCMCFSCCHCNCKTFMFKKK